MMITRARRTDGSAPTPAHGGLPGRLRILRRTYQEMGNQAERPTAPVLRSGSTAKSLRMVSQIPVLPTVYFCLRAVESQLAVFRWRLAVMGKGGGEG